MSKPEGFEFNFISVAAYKKIEAKPTFLFFRSERITGGFLLTGATSSRNYKSGKRKGRPHFDGPKVQVLVTEEEVTAAEEAYEALTGKCYSCLGEGKKPISWNIETGTKYGNCKRCSNGKQ
jgi:hypothetical protein